MKYIRCDQWLQPGNQELGPGNCPQFGVGNRSVWVIIEHGNLEFCNLVEFNANIYINIMCTALYTFVWITCLQHVIYSTEHILHNIYITTIYILDVLCFHKTVLEVQLVRSGCWWPNFWNKKFVRTNLANNSVFGCEYMWKPLIQFKTIISTSNRRNHPRIIYSMATEHTR